MLKLSKTTLFRSAVFLYSNAAVLAAILPFDSISHEAVSREIDHVALPTTDLVPRYDKQPPSLNRYPDDRIDEDEQLFPPSILVDLDKIERPITVCRTDTSHIFESWDILGSGNWGKFFLNTSGVHNGIPSPDSIWKEAIKGCGNPTVWHSYVETPDAPELGGQILQPPNRSLFRPKDGPIKDYDFRLRGATSKGKGVKQCIKNAIAKIGGDAGCENRDVFLAWRYYGTSDTTEHWNERDGSELPVGSWEKNGKLAYIARIRAEEAERRKGSSMGMDS